MQTLDGGFQFNRYLKPVKLYQLQFNEEGCHFDKVNFHIFDKIEDIINLVAEYPKAK